MKTISTKTNAAFKRAQPLPPPPSLPPLRAGGAALSVATCNPPPGALCRKMTDLAACALSVSQGFNAPAVRLMS
ncbi:MAG: hypothetical protein V9H26_16590 [Verrucomicrobiota bacterium]